MSVAGKCLKTATVETFSRQMYIHTHIHIHIRTLTHAGHARTQVHWHTHTHTHSGKAGRQAALNVGHWALLSLKRAETVPKPPLQSDRFRTPEKNTVAAVAAAAPASRRRPGQVFKCAQKPLPSRIADRSRRVLLTWTLHRGGGGREGWGEKQEAYFTLRCTVMRNRDSRAHYFANSRSEKWRGPLCDPLRGKWRLLLLAPHLTSRHFGIIIIEFIGNFTWSNWGKWLLKEMLKSDLTSHFSLGVTSYLLKSTSKTVEASLTALSMSSGSRLEGAMPGVDPGC